ncbi:unnamed protein product [Cylindrotheca closterium]|uniref:histidine kinase n=1 Tax=Cylindrotheca closterium TaxID=2856 RepID=A0AAD2G277_9STRA|nr:unnamed protein product [Cylindrotheca closterium]
MVVSKTSYSEQTARTNDSRGVPNGRRRGLPSRVQRTVALRAMLIFSLFAAAAICASLAYTQLKSTERNVGLETYRSIASSATRGAQEITQRKVKGSEVMGTLMGQVFPNSEDWPMISMDGYIPIAQSIAALSATWLQALVVVVRPEEAEAFENHTKEVYKAQNRPNSTGYSDFGYGIWKPDRSENKTYADGRLHDISGENEWGGKRKIMTPLMMHNMLGASTHLYNPYSEADRAPYLDDAFDCAELHEDATTSPQCGVITDMVELKSRDGPAALLYLPIYPANDPTNVVGIAASSIHFEEVLTNVVPDYVDGLTCVISTDTAAYTFEIRNGKPMIVGKGDLHDPAFDSYGQTVVLNDIETGALTSAKYKLTVYPTTQMLDAFTTTSPLTVALGFAGVIAAVAFLFFLYDYLVRREAQKRQEILEMKRRFVRFISHEIRTPLNTVCMGLELLQSELKSPPGLGTGSPTVPCSDEDLGFLLNVTQDTNENAHIAVEILNDLLNYDKLETGTLELETEPVLIWDLIEQTIHQFGIQAVNRGVELKLHMEKPAATANTVQDIEAGKESFDPYNVVGDRCRLSQVIRNVISNALKFTPVKGSIDVTATYIPNGLPHAQPMLAPGEEGAIRQRAGSVRLSVKDTGVGLSREQLSRLFSEGVQFDANRLQHGGGSGLGLSIAKGLVEQHRGTISADSEGFGKGTIFSIELPLYEFGQSELEAVHWSDKDSHTEPTEESQSTIGNVDSSSEGGVAAKAAPSSRRVLVAEDSASSRKMLIRLLERAGHKCVPAGNGQEAVDAIKEDMEKSKADPSHIPIDSVLMDYEMPLLRGPEASAEIRRNGYQGIIVGVSGNVLSEDIDFFVRHGADSVLAKPVSLKRIQAYWKEVERKAAGKTFAAD